MINDEKDVKKKMQNDQQLKNGIGILDILKTVPDQEKRRLHLEKMIRAYHKACSCKNTGPVKLEDGELDLIAAASAAIPMHFQKCPICGVELLPARLEEHQRVNHGML